MGVIHPEGSYHDTRLFVARAEPRVLPRGRSTRQPHNTLPRSRDVAPEWIAELATNSPTSGLSRPRQPLLHHGQGAALIGPLYRAGDGIASGHVFPASRQHHHVRQRRTSVWPDGGGVEGQYIARMGAPVLGDPCRRGNLARHTDPDDHAGRAAVRQLRDGPECHAGQQPLLRSPSRV